MMERAPQFSDDELLAALRALLSGADADGKLDRQEYWRFGAALAQGRGLSDGLHNAGLEARTKVQPDGMAATFTYRQRRAYHIALLTQLLDDVGASEGGGGSILPANFNHGAVGADLRVMVAGRGGMGDGDPQFLNTARGGENFLRRHARHLLVGVVQWSMGRWGQTRDEAWRGVMGCSASKKTLENWMAEVGGPDGEFVRMAYAAGQANDMASPFAVMGEDLAKVVELAKGSQGNRSQQSK